MDIDTFCRLCLEEYDSQKLTDILEKKLKLAKLFVRKYLGFEVCLPV